MLHDLFHVLPYMTLGKRCNGNSLDESGIWKSITRLMWFGFPKAQTANGLEKGIQVFFAAATMGPVSVFAAGAG